MNGISRQGKAVFGSDALYKALQLLADPVLFNERLEALAKAETDAAATIACVGPAQEVLRIREELANELEQAKAERISTMGQAQKIVDDAKAEAAKILERVTADEKTVRDRLDKALSALESQTTAAREYEEHLDKRKAKLDEEMVAFEAQRTELEHERSEVIEARAANTAERERLLAIKARFEESLAEPA